ncbi:hypothetical protein ACTFIZ_007838, partial [Dictyostelium cf. discoideum]
YLRCV